MQEIPHVLLCSLYRSCPQYMLSNWIHFLYAGNTTCPVLFSVQILSTVHVIQLDTFPVCRKHHMSCSVSVQILSSVHAIQHWPGCISCMRKTPHVLFCSCTNRQYMPSNTGREAFRVCRKHHILFFSCTNPARSTCHPTRYISCMQETPHLVLLLLSKRASEVWRERPTVNIAGHNTTVHVGLPHILITIITDKGSFRFSEYMQTTAIFRVVPPLLQLTNGTLARNSKLFAWRDYFQMLVKSVFAGSWCGRGGDTASVLDTYEE